MEVSFELEQLIAEETAGVFSVCLLVNTTLNRTITVRVESRPITAESK